MKIHTTLTIIFFFRFRVRRAFFAREKTKSKRLFEYLRIAPRIILRRRTDFFDDEKRVLFVVVLPVVKIAKVVIQNILELSAQSRKRLLRTGKLAFGVFFVGAVRRLVRDKRPADFHERQA